MKSKQKTNQNREWHLIDAKDQILGRLAVKIAKLLRGKDKPIFVPYLDLGDYVVVTNVAHIRFTGRKLEQKFYYSHSGYPGGLQKTSLKHLYKERPEEVLQRAVSGMLPNNRLKSLWLKRLYIFKNNEHPYQDKFKKSAAKEQ
ncbi:MAG: 50S ribosomal protein L13 [Candidatus Berkelbacteria bacterium]|nr:50S ribosomal protein L13 [Candidatus Berkelbacteria bacterium]